MNRVPVSFLIALALVAVRQLTASTAAEIVVSVPDHTLALLDGGKVLARYCVSTTKFGNGDNIGSYRTPLGTLFVSGKFGNRLPVGTVIKIARPRAKSSPSMHRIVMPSFRG